MREKASILGMLAGAFLAGCGDPSMGGGTELPIQVRITVESRTEAKQWRLWTVEENTNAARHLLGSSYTFVSRGILEDSAGVLSLPSDPGLFLLEAWVGKSPADSLDVAIPSLPGFSIDTSCMQAVPRSGDIVQVRRCMSFEARQMPSGRDSAHAPDMFSVLRIEGESPQRLQILDDAGSLRLLPAEARLWSISTDSGDDQTLLFRGRLSREADGTFRLPVLQGHRRFLIEAATKANSMRSRISTRTRISTGWTRYMECMENILSPLPGTFSVHGCPDLGWNLSGLDSASVGADIWSAFSLDIH